MKTLGATELSILRGFVRDVLEICNYDDTDVTVDLYEPALQCAELLGMAVERQFDEDDPDLEQFYPDPSDGVEEDA